MIKKNKTHINRSFICFIKSILTPIKIIIRKKIPSKFILQYLYYKSFHKFANLRNPKKFSEKILCRWLYDRKKIYTTCADKFLVRDFVKEKIWEEYLIPLLLETKELKESDFDNLPKNFVIKSNHASWHIIIVEDKSKINIDEIITKTNERMNVNFYYNQREIQYRDIEPRILIEKKLTDHKWNIPNDYKFHCFNGKVEFIQIDSWRFERERKRINLKRDWSIAPFLFLPFYSWLPAFKKDETIKPPKKLKKMVNLAEALSKEFNYVRVDFYEIWDEIYFGELTFTPWYGWERFIPEKYDLIYGNKFNY